MQEFLRLYNDKYYERGWCLNTYHSSITGWCISIGYKSTHPKKDELVISVENSDMELAYAKAQVELKEWLLDNEGGY